MSDLDYGEIHHMKNFVFLIGAAKCGTTSLAHWLSQHPQICMSIPKEPKYFTMEYHMGTSWYNKTYFDHYAGEQWVCDARPQNFMVDFVAARIFETRPNPRFIVLVRDPIERAYSAWQHFHNMRPGREPESFDTVMRANLESFRVDIFKREWDYMKQVDPRGGCYEPTYLEGSNYMDNVARFARWFGKDSILIRSLDDMNNSKLMLVKDICDFLGIKFDITSPGILDWSIKKQSPVPTKRVNIQNTFPLIFEKLWYFFKPMVQHFSEYVNRDFITEWGYHNL